MLISLFIRYHVFFDIWRGVSIRFCAYRSKGDQIEKIENSFS